MKLAVLKPEGFRAAMKKAWAYGLAAVKSDPVVITIKAKQSVRKLEQNRKMWALLGDISKQIEWPVNGRFQTISSADFKDILTAAYQGETRMAEGVNGGFVFLGMRTRRMTIKQMSEFIEFIYAFGAERNVVWSEPIPEEYFEYEGE